MKTRFFALLTLAGLALACVLVSSCAATGSAARGGSSPQAVPGSSPDNLPGKTWLLSGLRIGENFIPLEPGHGSSARLVFQADGTYSGNSGWNTFGGAWRAQKPDRSGKGDCKLTVTKTTRMATPNETAARFERTLLANLEGAASIQYGPKSIAFLDSRGEKLATFLFAPLN